MLKLMRDSFHHLKWILLAIVAAFIFGFVFVDMGLGGFGGAQAKAQGFAARVNGDTISYNEYYRALKNYEDMYRQMYGQQFTPELETQLGLPRQVLEALIDQRLLEQQAERLHLDATPEEVRRKLLTIPTFNQDGKFVGMELYTRYVTGPLGYPNAAAFEEELAREIALQKIDSAMTSSIVVSPKAAETEYRRMNENAKIEYVMLSAGDALPRVTVTPAEVEAYYKTNQAKYTHGEQRSVRYLLADYNKLRAAARPTDADLRKQYEENKDSFKTQDAAHVLHILVKVDPNAPPQVDQAAKAKANALVQQLRAGADFAALAKANSQDPSSAANGGDMGWVEKGQTVEPFERAIFSVPLNSISDPVRSAEYGYHIVKVVERRAAGFRSFEEVKPQLAARAADELAREQAKAEITRLKAAIKDKKVKSVDEFAAFANDKVTSNATGWFGRGEQITGIGANEELTQWAFSAQKGAISDPISTPRGVLVAYEENSRPSGVSTLAEIRPRVEQEAKLDKAREVARTQLAQLAAGASNIAQIGQKLGQAPRTVSVNRQTPISGLSGDTSALVDAAIAANIGEVKGPITVPDGAIVFQVIDQKKVTPAELAQNRLGYVDTLRTQQARGLRASLIKRLRAGAKVEVNEELLKPQAQQQGV